MKKALVIANEAFMDNFLPDWKAQFEFEYYSEKMGQKQSLPAIQQKSYDALFVDDEALGYDEDTFFCWLRVLKEEGILALKSKAGISPLALHQPFSQVVSYQENTNVNVWLYFKDTKRLGKSYIDIYVDFNNALLRNDLMSALESLENMALLDPDSPAAFLAKVQTLQKAGVTNQEETVFQRYLRYKINISAHLFNVCSILLAGNYQEGFKAREKLFELVEELFPERRSPFPPKDEWLKAKRWKGESLANKHLVIWSEFGLGDEIMFAQLAHMLKLQGTKKITLVAQKPIISLLQTHPDIDEVIIRENANAELTHFDYWVYPHAILAHVAMPFQLQPKRIPYLSAIPEKQPLFCKKIIKNDRLKVGIVWRGDPSHENDANRSIHDLGPIEKLFNSDNVDFYCLQKEQNEAEKDLLARYQVTDLSADLHDMADTAAAISLLDCIVTVDTSVAHVAGALNKPTLLMLSYVVDWRWGSYQRENLWYPNMQSIRWRAMIEDWHYVIDEVKQALAKISTSR